MDDWLGGASGVDQGAGAARAAVLRLDVSRFRNYSDVRVETDGRPVVLTGPNGAGKTNLLEALSFLSPGRGLRRARLAEIDQRSTGSDCADAAPWAVAARIGLPSGEIVIGTGREVVSERQDRRVVRIDGGTARSQATLAQYLALVWLTPQMDRLFQEGATPRRRFLDRLVFCFDPEHARRLTSYEHAMRERTRLLAEAQSEPAWLSMLEDSMAREGIAITAGRLDMVERLNEACRQCGAGHGLFPVPHLELLGATEGWLESMSALEAEERFRSELAALRRRDAQAGLATFGAHRADFMARHAATGAAATDCSTGEQKGLLISIIFAHARLHSALDGLVPILLLDEVAAHLDRDRRRTLFHRVLETGSQAWLTGTDPDLFEDLRADAHFLSVTDGSIRELPDPG